MATKKAKDQDETTEQPQDGADALAAAGGPSERDAFAESAQAATGDVVEVPKTPEEIGEQATALGLAGDHATGGNPPADDPGRLGGASGFTRVWAMDADHTERNRNNPDQLKPDCSVQA